MKIAIIGAGLAGLTAARQLRAAGLDIQVFEKSRGLGGRLATRRWADCSFDHGGQYFTARDPAFVQAVADWRAQGVAAPWPLRLGRVEGGRIQASPDDEVRYVAVPGMNALGKYLAQDLAVRRQTKIVELTRAEKGWSLLDADRHRHGPFDAVLSSAPAPQTAELLRTAAPDLAVQASEVRFEPVWTVLLAFAAEQRLDFDGLFFADGPLRWAANNGSKPGRQGNHWVLHAQPDWARPHLDDPPESVIETLSQAFCAVTGFDPNAIQHSDSQRWRYSLTTNPREDGALWDAELGIGACGDWCVGARVEGAYLSGLELARRVLSVKQ